MDCRTASELIMKYMDGEIGYEDEQLLLGHINSCRCCNFEFQSIKKVMLMLNEVEMEEAPEDLEKKVISRIKQEEEAKIRARGWMLGAAACIVLIMGWAVLTYLAVYTPAMDVIKGCFKIFAYCVREFADILAEGWRMGVTLSARLISLGRTMEVVIGDLVNVYNTVIYAAGLLGFMGLYTFNFIRKAVGR